VYKIVKLKDGKNVPVYANPQCEVEYVEGVQTVRNEYLGPFTAIDTLSNAVLILSELRKTIVNMTNLRLHECTGDLSTETSAWYINGSKTVTTPLSKLPVGTVLLDTITVGSLVVV
jgi:hypothetical protein